MNRQAPVLHVFSLIMLLLFSLTMFVPQGLAWGLRDGDGYTYGEAVVISLGAGAIVLAGPDHLPASINF